MSLTEREIHAQQLEAAIKFHREEREHQLDLMRRYARLVLDASIAGAPLEQIRAWAQKSEQHEAQADSCAASVERLKDALAEVQP